MIIIFIGNTGAGATAIQLLRSRSTSCELGVMDNEPILDPMKELSQQLYHQWVLDAIIDDEEFINQDFHNGGDDKADIVMTKQILTVDQWDYG